MKERDYRESEKWKLVLKQLGFTEKKDRKGSYYIMEKDGFEVEFSTGHLWENESKDQSNITNIDDLKSRYKHKTGQKL